MALVCLGGVTQASANFRLHPTRLYGGLLLGFGGTVEVEHGVPRSEPGRTLGGQAGFERIVARYFSLGGEARFSRVPLGELGRQAFLIDLDLKPRVRLLLGESAFELYGTVPLGLTVPRLVGDDPRLHLDQSVGWNVGLGAGLNWFVTHRLALNVEPSLLVHHLAVAGSSGDGGVTVKQFALLINAVFPL
ncbi:MAG: hypothetical protein JWN48_3786 [Myxococcaceae bacterium]|nr:hypothetical protein [Myxococcaceae bacterium]